MDRLKTDAGGVRLHPFSLSAIPPRLGFRFKITQFKVDVVRPSPLSADVAKLKDHYVSRDTANGDSGIEFDDQSRGLILTRYESRDCSQIVVAALEPFGFHIVAATQTDPISDEQGVIHDDEWALRRS